MYAPRQLISLLALLGIVVIVPPALAEVDGAPSMVDELTYGPGKLVGHVTEAATGEPLPGVQIFVVETNQGTVTDTEGYYSLINIKPGDYTVVFRFVGFATSTFTDVPVEPDKTYTLDVEMAEEIIEGEEVVVTAERPIVQMDRTTTTAFVGEKEIQALPVTNLSEIIDLQAGVVDGHFRGGRDGEVMYMVNGIPINNPYDNSQGISIEKNMVQGLEVISGVFNAEYGQAMSGIVNIVTKDSPHEWSGEIQAEIGAIASTRNLEFVERNAPAGSELRLSDFDSVHVPYHEAAGAFDRQDLQVSLGGPLIGDRLGFRLTGRYRYEESDDISRRLFMPTDSSQNLNSGNPDTFVIESNGDQEFVQGHGETLSLNGSTSLQIAKGLRMDYNGFFEWGEGRDNDFLSQYSRKYVPGGLNRWYNRNQLHVATLRYSMNDHSFATLSYGLMRDKRWSRLFDIPDDFDATGILDPRYVRTEFDNLNGANAFNVGGNQLFNSSTLTRTHTFQVDYTNQLTRVHQMKAGAVARMHALENGRYDIEVSSNTGWQPMPSVSRYGRDSLETRPYEIAAYLQDKMEFDNLIVNAGIRFDYFQPDFQVPIDWSQAGLTHVPNLPGWRHYDATQPDSALILNRQDAAARYQVSPRFGVAFPISSTGVIRFSAGLFFQVPRLEWIYRNPNYEIDPRAGQIAYGNAAINPERTLHFEIALQQALTDALGFELTLFSKDFRNLTTEQITRDVATTKIVRRFINNDVGTSRGVTLSIFQRPIGPLSWNVDYTLQFAEGTASDPEEAFQRFQSNLDDIKVLERLNWDRRHVLNNRITLAPSTGLSVTMINRWRTGLPYTTVRDFVTSYQSNNDDQPSAFTSDLRLYYSPPFIPDNFQLTALVVNLFDAQIHEDVFASTGRADEDVTLELFRRSDTGVGGVNSLEEFFLAPYRFSEPRRVTLGALFTF